MSWTNRIFVGLHARRRLFTKGARATEWILDSVRWLLINSLVPWADFLSIDGC